MSNTPKLRLFISKSMKDLETLPAFCKQNDIQLAAHSFLSFEAVPFEVNSSFDIVFFASPRAVHFFVKIVDCSSKLIAVAGESTRKTAELLGLTVHFSPRNSGNINEGSCEFALWANDKRVLFPTSDISQKSYSKYLNNTQIEFMQTYKTHILTKKIEKNDIYVFTSPSNVNGFLRSNIISSDSRVIAWGETTFKSLKDHVVPERLNMLSQSSEQQLIKYFQEKEI